MLYENVLEMVGNTPIVRINKINPNPGVNVYIKLEGQNPGGSVKDRIGLAMIDAAEKDGALTKKKIILEPTSGNTGIGLAMVAALKGYRVVFTMSEGMSEERKKILRALGAELVLTDKTKGTDGAIMMAHEMLEKDPDKYWMPDQFSNPANPEIHYRTTAVEILHDVPHITHFVAGMGTSGTVMGVSKKLREQKPDVEIIAVEPIFGHKLQGLKNMNEAIVPKIYDANAYDTKVNVEDARAHEAIRRIAREEGIFLGMSAGAALYASLEIAKTLDSGNIVMIAPDRGEKYVSTALFG